MGINKNKPDNETIALNKVVKIMKTLPADQCQRIIGYLDDRFVLSAPEPAPPGGREES